MATIDQKFVEYVVKSLVNYPEDVQIDRSIDEKGVLLLLIQKILVALLESAVLLHKVCVQCYVHWAQSMMRATT